MCRKSYIGEIGWTSKMRIKNHCADINNNRINKSTLAKHSYNIKHPIKIEDIRILEKIITTPKEKSKRWIGTMVLN